jgi:predicted DNA binding CopG/RHH family protein
MKKNEKKDVAVLLRMERSLYKELEREAGLDGRTVQNYIRYLLSTDPRRKKK